MKYALVIAAALVLGGPALATPSKPSPVPLRRPAPRSTPRPAATPHPDAAALYSRRTRRLVQSYLRLKLWEMREADLERARKVVERKLGVRYLLSETPVPAPR
ncbi:MAG TPA: hypothetical protein VHT05_01540 [Candidatus Elarobacter sp.]|nr:hypothetical protein [Candidatus Elarobacter sp.]